MIMPSSSYQNPKARGVPLGGGIDPKASHPHNHKTCNGLGLGFELILAHLPLSISSEESLKVKQERQL